MRRADSRRAGFTLIEMLVVIMIILLLVGLLLPAVQKARDAAMRAQVKSEIANIGTGIENFKTTYDVKYIPTFFILSNDYNFPPGDPWGPALTESREFYAKVWPKAFLPPAITGGKTGFTPLANDVFRIQLDGNQLLVFLLGGVPPASSPPPGKFAPWPPSFNPANNRSGFLNSPTNPFGFANGAENSPPQANQAKLFFDFNPKRVDNNGHFHDPYWKVVTDPNDPTINLSVYYYFSSKHGNDYDYWGRVYAPIFNPGGAAGGPTLAGGYGFMNPHVGLDAKYVEPNGYQIVSAGKDQTPSAGGQLLSLNPRVFDPNYVWPGSGSYKAPRSGQPNAPPVPPYDPTGGGNDDVSNFSPYALGSDR